MSAKLHDLQTLLEAGPSDADLYLALRRRGLEATIPMGSAMDAEALLSAAKDHKRVPVLGKDDAEVIDVWLQGLLKGATPTFKGLLSNHGLYRLIEAAARTLPLERTSWYIECNGVAANLVCSRGYMEVNPPFEQVTFDEADVDTPVLRLIVRGDQRGDLAVEATTPQKKPGERE